MVSLKVETWKLVPANNTICCSHWWPYLQDLGRCKIHCGVNQICQRFQGSARLGEFGLLDRSPVGKRLRFCTPAKTEIQVPVWPSQECCTSPFSKKEIHNHLDIQTNLNCDLMVQTVISLQGKVLSINHVNIPFVTPLHVLLNFLMKSWKWSSTGPGLREQRERRDVTGNYPFSPLHVTLGGCPWLLLLWLARQCPVQEVALSHGTPVHARRDNLAPIPGSQPGSSTKHNCTWDGRAFPQP